MAALSALLATAAGNAQAATCPAIEIAVVAHEGEAGARTFGAADGHPLMVRSRPLVSSRDIIDAGVSSAEGATGLDVRVSADAKERVRSYTAGHIGDRLAFIVEGRPKMVLKILDPIVRDGFWLSPMDPDAARKMASALRACAQLPP